MIVVVVVVVVKVMTKNESETKGTSMGKTKRGFILTSALALKPYLRLCIFA